MAILSGIALVVGLLAQVFAARSIADPLTGVRTALEKVAEGDLDVSVQVYDGSEIGLLQSGVNRMAEGLRERERLRDLFGRQVGADVAERALADKPQLGGEARDVSVLFVDLIGSTGLAEDRDPEEVVSMLNSFFSDAPTGKIFTDAAKALKPQHVGPKAGDVLTAFVYAAVWAVLCARLLLPPRREVGRG